MEEHRIKNIAIFLYTADVAETQRFYTSVLEINCDDISQTQVSLSFQSTTLVFTTNKNYSGRNPCFLNFEIIDLEQFWEATRFKVTIVQPITDTENGTIREFTIRDNNGYHLRFFQKNDTLQLSLDFYS